mgnify:FL=1|jgi:hypothetical protein
MVKTIKNFLNKKDFVNLQQFLLGNCNWFYKRHMTWNDAPFLNHCFYNLHTIQSDHYNLVLPLVKKLDMKAIIQIRANLTLAKEKAYKSDLHTDVNDLDSFTAIYYLTTCNGYTLIGDQKIKSIENQIVIFNSSIQHRMVSQTDTPERIVINLNYF